MAASSSASDGKLPESSSTPGTQTPTFRAAFGGEIVRSAVPAAMSSGSVGVIGSHVMARAVTFVAPAERPKVKAPVPLVVPPQAVRKVSRASRPMQG